MFARPERERDFLFGNLQRAKGVVPSEGMQLQQQQQYSNNTYLELMSISKSTGD